MNENIFTDGISKQRVTLFNKACIDNVKRYYFKEEDCGIDLLMLGCRAVRAGEAIFDEEFISNYADVLKSGDADRLGEILNLEIAAAKEKYFIENKQDINSLPLYIKDNKEVLSSFIREGLFDGFILAGRIISKLMRVAA